MWRKAIYAVLAAFALPALSAADVDITKLPPPSTKKGVTFEKDIKPLFERSCFECHGKERVKARLRLNTVEDIKKGSDYGPVIIVGNSAKSTLVHSMAGLIEDMMMPPEDKAQPLTKEELGLVRAWIDQGAK